jgi:hypothetical protein
LPEVPEAEEAAGELRLAPWLPQDDDDARDDDAGQPEQRAPAAGTADDEDAFSAAVASERALTRF